MDLAAAGLQLQLQLCTFAESPNLPRFGKEQPQPEDVGWKIGQRKALGLLYAAFSFLRVSRRLGLESGRRRWASCLQVYVDLGRDIHISIAILYVVFGGRLTCRAGRYPNVCKYVGGIYNEVNLHAGIGWRGAAFRAPRNSPRYNPPGERSFRTNCPPSFVTP